MTSINRTLPGANAAATEPPAATAVVHLPLSIEYKNAVMEARNELLALVSSVRGSCLLTDVEKVGWLDAIHTAERSLMLLL